jgi:hypothetical protein
VVDGVGARVVRTRHAELDVRDPLRVDARVAAQVGHRRRDRIDRVGVQEVHRRVDPPPDRARDVAHGRRHRRQVGAENVAHGDRHGVRGVMVGRVDLGVGTGARADVPDHAGQPGFGEPAQGLGDGGLGQPGQFAQLVAGQLAPFEQVSERRALVHRPQQLRRTGRTSHRRSV